MKKYYIIIQILVSICFFCNCNKESNPSPPTVDILSGPVGTINYTDVHFEWEGYDADADINGYYIDLDKNPPVTFVNRSDWYFNNVTEGQHYFYIFAIDKKGLKSNIKSRQFSVVPEKSINITNPNGGEIWEIGHYYDISWQSTNISDKVDIGIFRETEPIFWIFNVQNSGSYIFQVPSTFENSNKYKVKIEDFTSENYFDFSNDYFTIKKPTNISWIQVLSPNGSESWYWGESHEITWSSDGTINDNIMITITKNDIYYLTLTENTENDGSFIWTIPSSLDPPPSYRIFVWDANNESTFDYSDSPFWIGPNVPDVTVISPNGGENWLRGTTQKIKWHQKFLGNCDINLYKNAIYVKNLHIIVQSNNGDHEWDWDIPTNLAPGNDYSVEVRVNYSSDLSDTYFSLN